LPNLLTKLHLEELSLVDRPANAQATVSLFKRDNLNEDITKMTPEMEAKVKAYMDKNSVSREDAMKAMDTKKSDVNPLTAEVEALKASNEMLTKALIDNGYVITATDVSKSAPEETIDVGGKLIVKSLIPAPVLKALEDAAVEKAEYELEKADVELSKLAAAELPSFDLSIAKSLVSKFADTPDVMTALKAADAATASTMAEIGKSDADNEFTSTSDKIDALVKSYMDDNKMKKSEYALAYAAVANTETGKTLINKSYKGE
jgi:hypothetical protein